jgi:hypothetical protein
MLMIGQNSRKESQHRMMMKTNIMLEMMMTMMMIMVS